VTVCVNDNYNEAMNIMQVNLAHTQLIPTPNQSTNYFGILQNTMWDDDEETVVLSNLSKDKQHNEHGNDDRR
jgi:hypothetical protein